MKQVSEGNRSIRSELQLLKSKLTKTQLVLEIVNFKGVHFLQLGLYSLSLLQKTRR